MLFLFILFCGILINKVMPVPPVLINWIMYGTPILLCLFGIYHKNVLKIIFSLLVLILVLAYTALTGYPMWQVVVIAVAAFAGLCYDQTPNKLANHKKIQELYK